MRCKGWKVGVEANGRIYIYIYKQLWHKNKLCIILCFLSRFGSILVWQFALHC